MHVRERIKDVIWNANARCLSNPKHQPKADKLILVEEKNIKFYADTPNTIIYFNNGYEEGFFRECRLHDTPVKYVKKLIDDYCRYVFVNANSEECKQIITNQLSNKANFYKFFNMGAGTASYSRISKYRKNLDSDLVGLKGKNPKWFEDQILQLLQFIWGPLDEYRYNRFLSIGEYHVYNSSRSMITKIIADNLASSHIIPETYYAWLQFNGIKRFGVVEKPANGINPLENDISKFMIAGSFQRDLFLLNMIDVICYQRDHRPGNYFVEVANDEIIHVSAFDNDCPTTLAPTCSLKIVPYVGGDYIEKNGYLNRPYIDEEFYNALIRMSDEKINIITDGYISSMQKKALKVRILKLKRLLSKSINEQNAILLKKEMWSSDTIDVENSKYGDTYFNHFREQFLCEREICND